jgi:hypothetical protein
MDKMSGFETGPLVVVDVDANGLRQRSDIEVMLILPSLISLA